jgi:hypothetical protein
MARHVVSPLVDIVSLHFQTWQMLSRAIGLR